jgi:GNAT superfamily N-acetyltransferase
MRRNPTTPLPAAFPSSEPALMTRAEFIDFRNPQGKHHEASSYGATVASLNSVLQSLGTAKTRRRAYDVQGLPMPYGKGRPSLDRLVFIDQETKQVAGVLARGVLRHDRFHDIPDHYSTFREHVPVRIRSRREVKEPADFLPLVADIAKINRKKYGHLLQRLSVGGEAFELRSVRPPVPDARDTLVLLNPKGQIVAQGTDEWGATLLIVAEEYRGRGLGRLLAEAWYEHNPTSTSGGFTPAGASNAKAAWVDRVREFEARGWYSALVQRGDLTKARVKQILSGLPKKRPSRTRLPQVAPASAAPDLRIFVDDDGTAFVVYDARFLDDPDEQYVHGYGFFRDAPRIGTFLYRIDYDPEYRKLTTATALQLARDNGDRIYVGGKPGDMVDYTGLPHVKRSRGYLTLTEDVLPLADARRVEKALRTGKDRRGEMVSRLLEAAEAKWAS